MVQWKGLKIKIPQTIFDMVAGHVEEWNNKNLKEIFLTTFDWDSTVNCTVDVDNQSAWIVDIPHGHSDVYSMLDWSSIAIWACHKDYGCRHRPSNPLSLKLNHFLKSTTTAIQHKKHWTRLPPTRRRLTTTNAHIKLKVFVDMLARRHYSRVGI